MNTQLRTIALVTILAALCCLSACSKHRRNSKNALLGTWIKVTATADESRMGVGSLPQGSTIEFLRDGTFILERNMSTTYRILAKKRLSIAGYAGISILYEFTVDGDQLILTEDDQGKSLDWVYRRSR